MKKIIVNFPEVKLVGIREKTNNANEIDPKTAKVASTFQIYMENTIAAKIQNRVREGVNFCVYTDYENDKITDPLKCDYHGDFTYFIGEAVSSFENISEDLKTIVIPAQKYVRFTTARGIMPNIVINAWVDIWKMTSNDLGGERSYTADFEVYDFSNFDPLAAEVNIYIGIK